MEKDKVTDDVKHYIRTKFGAETKEKPQTPQPKEQSLISEKDIENYFKSKNEKK